MLPCDRQTPLAEPVVPEVNKQHAQRVRVDFERSERVRALFAPLVPLADQAGDADGFVVALHLHDQTALERVPVQLGQRLDVPDDGFAVGFV